MVLAGLQIQIYRMCHQGMFQHVSRWCLHCIHTDNSKGHLSVKQWRNIQLVSSPLSTQFQGPVFFSVFTGTGNTTRDGCLLKRVLGESLSIRYPYPGHGKSLSCLGKVYEPLPHEIVNSSIEPISYKTMVTP
jgi:hypothetical protein